MTRRDFLFTQKPRLVLSIDDYPDERRALAKTLGSHVNKRSLTVLPGPSYRCRTMGPESKSRAVWEQMSDEVWATVFPYFKPPQEDDFYHSYLDRLGGYKQSWFLGLPLVCKKFHLVFARNPQLCSNLLLNNQRTNRHLVGLLDWVTRHSASITRVASSCGSPCLEAVLAVMQQQKSGLHRITVEVANDHTLSLFAAFRTLTQCTFLKPPENLSLKALEVLPSLTTLNVCEAYVSGIEALLHLKSLDVYKSKVECAHNFQSVTSLLHMDVSSSTVLHFHDRGILACTRLQSLECQVGSILASDPAFSFSMDSDVQIPRGFTDLTALASLSISGRGQPEDTSLE